MKTIQNFFILISLFIIVSCNDKNSAPTPNLFAGSMTDFFSDHEQQYQTFTFPANTNISFTGAKGLQFEFPANCFVDENGQLVAGNVNIKVKEFVEKSDFILNRLYTVSGGMPLESGGAYEINVLKNGKELKVAPGKTYNVLMLQSASTPMYVYNGSTLNAQFGRVDWEIASSLTDTVITQQVDSNLFENLLRTADFEFVNCDRPYVTSFAPLIGIISSSEEASFMIITDKFRNMAIGFNIYETDFHWSYAPMNSVLTVAAMYKSNNLYFLSTMDVSFTGQSVVMPAYQQKTESEILDFIENL